MRHVHVTCWVTTVTRRGGDPVAQRLVDDVKALSHAGIAGSIGSVGDALDNALMESTIGLYKTELIRGPARTSPWKTIDDVELATLGWVHWHNTQRLHGYLGDVPPAEFETAFYAAQEQDRESDKTLL